MKTKHLLALGVLLAGVTAAASLTGAQKSALPQPTEQQKLKERVDALESQLKEAQAKADRAAMEKDYIERIQKEVNAYYEKAFNTQLATVTIIGLIVGLIGKFGVDHIVQSKLTKASTTLRDGFRKELTDELQKLRDSNAAQINQLEDDLMLRSEYGFQVLQALTQATAHEYAAALDCRRDALRAYKRSKPRQLFSKEFGPNTLHQIFFTIEEANPANFREVAKEELANELYDGLEEELAQAALQLEWLAPLVRERKRGAPAPTQPATPAAVPAPAQKSPEPGPDKTQPAKPEQGENK
jgi:uncharacterized membrane protein (DUF106 family)